MLEELELEKLRCELGELLHQQVKLRAREKKVKLAIKRKQHTVAMTYQSSSNACIVTTTKKRRKKRDKFNEIASIQVVSSNVAELNAESDKAKHSLYTATTGHSCQLDSALQSLFPNSSGSVCRTSNLSTDTSLWNLSMNMDVDAAETQRVSIERDCVLLSASEITAESELKSKYADDSEMMVDISEEGKGLLDLSDECIVLENTPKKIHSKFSLDDGNKVDNISILSEFVQVLIADSIEPPQYAENLQLLTINDDSTSSLWQQLHHIVDSEWGAVHSALVASSDTINALSHSLKTNILFQSLPRDLLNLLSDYPSTAESNHLTLQRCIVQVFLLQRMLQDELKNQEVSLGGEESKPSKPEQEVIEIDLDESSARKTQNFAVVNLTVSSVSSGQRHGSSNSIQEYEVSPKTSSSSHCNNFPISPIAQKLSPMEVRSPLLPLFERLRHIKHRFQPSTIPTHSPVAPFPAPEISTADGNDSSENRTDVQLLSTDYGLTVLPALQRQPELVRRLVSHIQEHQSVANPIAAGASENSVQTERNQSSHQNNSHSTPIRRRKREDHHQRAMEVIVQFLRHPSQRTIFDRLLRYEVLDIETDIIHAARAFAYQHKNTNIPDIPDANSEEEQELVQLARGEHWHSFFTFENVRRTFEHTHVFHRLPFNDSKSLSSARIKRKRLHS